MTDLQKNIKRLREEGGMTQEELAQRVGYKSRSSINKIELGLADITQSKIKDFAKALGVTPAYLMGWEEEKNTPVLDESVWEQIRGRKDIYSLVMDFVSLPDKEQEEVLEAAASFVKLVKQKS